MVYFEHLSHNWVVVFHSLYIANNQEQLVTAQMSRNKRTFGFLGRVFQMRRVVFDFERKDAILIRKAEIT